MKYIKKLISCLIFLCLSASVLAQGAGVKVDGVTPMHEFLQENADSTIIFHFTSNWFHIPEWFILSKKGDTLTAYHYHAVPAYDQRIMLPEAVAIKLKIRLVNMRHVTVDINDYFNPIYMEKDTINRFWQNIIQLKPWQIKDDADEGGGCPVEKGKTHDDIFDAGGVIIHLITRNNIKKIYFYAPEFYQKECPRKGRRDVLELQRLFLSHFTPVTL